MLEKVIVMGAAGRDFHNFNVYFRDNPRYRVKAFTAAQIPDIDERRYPAELAGRLYPDGIPIFPENDLTRLIQEHRIDLVVFSYSDVRHEDVMHKAALAMALGADFIMVGATYTMLKSKKPVVAVCAVRTGCGKSQTTREVARALLEKGLRPVVVRHPMPYGDLSAQAVQRFSNYQDLENQRCTIEEREEYEPLIDMGLVVYAGVDYHRILAAAEEEAEVLIWDGGNNDTPFFFPDVHIVMFDPHRAGHERQYFPGETNMLMAHVAVINKVDTAPPEGVAQVRANLERFAPLAEIVLAESPVSAERPEEIAGRRVLVVEDGPTLTHGEMAFGAGLIAAKKFGASEIVDPRPFAQGSLKDVFSRYPHVGPVLPAMGYSPGQIHDLEATINRAECDLVVYATPIALTRVMEIVRPSVRIRYDYRDHGRPRLGDVVLERLSQTAGSTV